ncbi:hypothetical protein [Alkalihalobacterium elongatum]|uniref:hypothetical protein n=1 Tax=Alkalihalobacterium elongatum TaxID=2675466 RepID=UPI001C200133|nr:hypothetical protein [Alkalihalobacterium elongatum]
MNKISLLRLIQYPILFLIFIFYLFFLFFSLVNVLEEGFNGFVLFVFLTIIIILLILYYFMMKWIVKHEIHYSGSFIVTGLNMSMIILTFSSPVIVFFELLAERQFIDLLWIVILIVIIYLMLPFKWGFVVYLRRKYYSNNHYSDLDDYGN